MTKRVWSLVWTACVGLTFVGGALAQSSGRTAAEDDVFWESVSGCTDAVEVELYIEEFGEEGRHVAAARECLKRFDKPDLAKLLGRRLFAEARDWKTGWTDLHYAAAAASPEAVADLVGSGVPVDARLASGPELGDRSREVLSALGHGEAFKSWNADGETPLMIAAYIDAVAAAAALAERGADIHAKNDYGMTPLHDAARGNAMDVARWLVEHGADVDAKNNTGKTPLQVAEDTEMRSILRSLGVD